MRKDWARRSLAVVLAALIALSTFPINALAGANLGLSEAAGVSFAGGLRAQTAVPSDLNAPLSPSLTGVESAVDAAAGADPFALPPSAIAPEAAEFSPAIEPGKAPERSIDVLRQAGAALEQGADARKTVEQLFVKLKLPSGSELQVQPAVSEQEKMTLMMHREAVPHDGVITAMDHDGAFHVWSKNTLVPTDVIGVGTDGKIKTIIHDMPASRPETPWRQVALAKAEGLYSIVLRAGRAKAEGLAVGQAIAIIGMPPAALRIEAHDLAMKILERPPQEALQVLRDNPMRFRQFDDALSIVSTERRAAKVSDPAKFDKYREAEDRFYRAAFADKKLGGLIQGVLSWHAPWLWFKNLLWDDSLSRADNVFMSAFFLPMISPLWGADKLDTLVHEIGHYAAAALVGGRPGRLRVFPSGGGYMTHAGNVGGLAGAFIAAAGPGLQFLAGAVLLIWAACTHSLWLLGPRGAVFYDPYSALSLNWVFMLPGLYSMLGALPSGIIDWSHAAAHLGWTRLSAEINYRRQLPDYMNGFYYNLFYDLFVRERLGTQPARK